jgi:hypothetical protein
MAGGEREYEGSEYERDDYEAARMQAEMDDMIEEWWSKLMDGKVHPSNAAYVKEHEVMAKWFFKMGFIAAGCQASQSK